MKNRAILSREHAKELLVVVEEVKEVKKAKVEKPKVTKPVPEKKTLLMIDPVTGKVINSFKDIKDAVNLLSLSEPNILRAVKNGTKYKNALWKQKA
jgi:hypothetical protein